MRGQVGVDLDEIVTIFCGGNRPEVCALICSGNVCTAKTFEEGTHRGSLTGYLEL